MRYDGLCGSCDSPVAAGIRAGWDRSTRHRASGRRRRCKGSPRVPVGWHGRPRAHSRATCRWLSLTSSSGRLRSVDRHGETGDVPSTIASPSLTRLSTTSPFSSTSRHPPHGIRPTGHTARRAQALVGVVAELDSPDRTALTSAPAGATLLAISAGHINAGITEPERRPCRGGSAERVSTCLGLPRVRPAAGGVNRTCVGASSVVR